MTLQGEVAERVALQLCPEKETILRLNNIDNRMFSVSLSEDFSREDNKANFTLRLKFMQIQHKLFLIVCYEKCFWKSSDRGFFYRPDYDCGMGNGQTGFSIY